MSPWFDSLPHTKKLSLIQLTNLRQSDKSKSSGGHSQTLFYTPELISIRAGTWRKPISRLIKLARYIDCLTRMIIPILVAVSCHHLCRPCQDLEQVKSSPNIEYGELKCLTTQ